VDSLPLPDGRTAAPGEERVLLSFGGVRDRELLRSWLDDEFEVVEGTPDEVARFDLCLVDEANYAAFESTLAARREAATPAFLPVLVLATEPRVVPDHADDVVVMPTRTELLGSRVRSLLRTRRLTRELSLFRRAMDAATVGVCITLAPDDQPIVYLNDAFVELTGYDREAALGRNCRFLQGEATDPEAVAELRAAVDEGGTATVVLRNYRADGTPFWNRVSIMPVREGGEVTHFVGFQRDVTERIERQRELEQHEAIVRSMREAAWILDTDSRFAFVNPNVTQGAVDDPTALVGEPLSSLAEFFPDDGTLERYSRYVDEILAGEREEATLTIEPLVAGPPLTIELTLAPMRRAGTVEGVVGLSRDVTERIERQRELEQHEAIVESMHESAWILDTEGRIGFVNPQAVESTGFDSGDVVGIPLEDFVASFPDDGTLERYTRYVDEILAGEREEATLTFEPQTSGQQRVVEVTLAPLVSDGEVTGVVGLSRDVTERVERDRRISVLDRVLRHNLRNKLNVVLANARDLPEDESTVTLARGIEAAAEELLALSDTARRFEGAIRPTGTSVHSTDVASHVTHVVEETMGSHGIDIETDIPDEAGAFAHESFELAVEELVENAVAHSEGSPTVSVAVTDRPDEGVVEFRVADEGPGLPEMERAVLSQGEETPLEHMEGLGLWFVYWTVAASGGLVSVTENDPHGTVVTISLPRVSDADPVRETTSDSED
jgi:PAS domain S-box-containing protein